MSLQSIRNKILGGGESSVLEDIRNKLLTPKTESDKPQSLEYDDNTLPFGALSVTQDGMAYYGEGFHGWVRKTYGDLFDPAKRLPNASEDDMLEYQSYVRNYQQKFEQNDFWNKWGEKIFGLSSAEAGNVLAAMTAPPKIMAENLQQQVSAGEITNTEAALQLAGEGIAQSVNISKDALQRSLWGALEILGLTDVGVRKLMAVRLGLDELADKYGTPDEGTNFFQQFNPQGEGFWAGTGRSLLGFADAVSQLGIVGQVKDAVTVAKAVSQGKLSVKDILAETYGKKNEFLRGSSAIYTLAADEMVRREFQKRTAMGEDPGFVAAELGRPGLEFAGSILGDPATYLGLSIVKPKIISSPLKIFGREIKFLGNVKRISFVRIGKIPTFGELVGLSVDAAREAAAERHFFSFANKEIEQLLKKGFDDGENAMRYFDEAARKVIRPGEEAFLKGKKIVKTAIGDLSSQIEEVRKAANRNLYKFTSYTAQSKINLAARDSSLVIDMIYSGSHGDINVTLETLADMRLMHSAPDELTRLNAAKRLMTKGAISADGKITGHGALFFSEAGLLTGDLLSRLDPRKIDSVFVKYGDDPIKFQNELYNLLESAYKEVFPSVDEMADAKRLVRAGNVDPKNIELAKRYDELPAHVRTISKIHRKTSKVVGASTGMQVNLYMRYSPGFVARNIFGQGAGIALDMGLGRALRTSIDAFFKPFVEWFTAGKLSPAQQHIVSRVQQVYDMAGVAPHKMLEAIGMSEVKNAKAMLKVGQTGEAMTAADIVADTVFDEIHKALPGVLSGDGSVKTLIDSGLMDEKQANALVKLVTDYNGNTSKAVNAFKKIFGKQAELWRLEPLPEGVVDILKRTGDIGDIQRLQLEAASRDEFVKGVNEILSNIEKAVKKNAANEVASLDSDAMRQMGDVVNDVIDMMNSGNMSTADADYIARIAQGWQNVRRHLDEVTTLVRDELVKMSYEKQLDTTPFTRRIEKIKAAFEKTHAVRNSVNEMAWKMVDALNGKHHVTGEAVEMLTPQQVWERFQVGNVFDIRKEFPQPPASIREAIDQVHRAAKYFAADFWRSSNNTLYDETLKVFSEWANAAGTSIDDIASLHNLPNDPFKLLQKSYREAQRLEALRPDSYQKLAKAPFVGATLDDMIFAEGQVDAAGRQFNKKYVFNAINAERKAQGLQPFATYGDVPWDEVQKVMRSRMGRFATPAEIVKKVNAKLAETEKVKKVKLTSETPLDELPEPVLEKVKLLAKRMLDELHGGQVEKTSGGGRIGSTNIKWWQEASEQNRNRKAVEKALEKLVEGKDPKTANVQRIKEMIFDRLRFGDPNTGTPPDLYALQQLGADSKTMRAALDDFNEITKNNFSLQEAIDASTPSDELLRSSADMPFYNEKGELIQPKRYARVQDIPEELVKSVIEPERFPPPMNEEFITTARAYLENLDGFMEEAGAWAKRVADKWGVTEPAELPHNLEEGLSKWKKVVDDRMQIVKDKALVIAGEKRDFLLHDYNKTYADVALAYLMPFSYWHTRTYARWAQRIVDNPKWANMYMAYRRKVEKEHADAPEWWRYNVGISIPGINSGNPIFLNLEATINPLNGLTGVDFNDPYKRVDWLSRTVDDLGKMGPSFAAPLNWAVAAWLYNKGEEEAAKRWLGRLIPQTTQIKGLLTKAGVDLNVGPFAKHNELDPFVNLTSDGLDPYELNRVNRHLAQIVEIETDPEKRQLLATQAVDAARTHSGPLWEQARRNAINERAGGQVASYLLGVGFKPRNEEDMKVDQFYNEYFKLIRLRTMMPADEYRESWNRLRDKYPFADALIIGKKSDPERDAAFAYNVLGRIPPGQFGDLFEQVGLSNEDINHFYETKGDFSNWSEGDQKRFMAAVVDLSAILQMPKLSTRKEWDTVKNDYQKMKDVIANQLGDDIWEKVEQYYALKNEARYKGNAYLHDHPEVSKALDLQTQMLVRNQLLYKYYGSLNTLQSYYNGEVRKKLEEKYGVGIYEIYYTYLDMVDEKQKKALLAQYPQLKAFIKEKGKTKDAVNRAIVAMALKLPDRPEVDYRSDLVAPTTAQQNLINTLNIPTNVNPQQIWNNASPALQELVTAYWLNGTELPYAARQNLNYLADEFGISGDEALQLMGIMLQQ